MAPFGFWTIHALNLSLCAIPKGGSSMNRQVVAKAAGVLDGRCFLDWKEDFKLRRAGVTPEYSPATTNIAIVRDPWTRAVSSFADQVSRGYVPKNKSYDAFLHYLRHYATREHTHHTGRVASKCLGHPGARFDEVIDLEQIASFAAAARRVPQYGKLIDQGWENCTGGEPRLYVPGSIATHANSDKLMHMRFCTEEAIRIVCNVYKEDYEVYAQLGHPYECACRSLVQGPHIPRNSSARS